MDKSPGGSRPPAFLSLPLQAKEALNKYRGVGFGEGGHQRSRKPLIFILPPIVKPRKGTLIGARSNWIGGSLKRLHDHQDGDDHQDQQREFVEPAKPDMAVGVGFAAEVQHQLAAPDMEAHQWDHQCQLDM